MAIPTVQRPSPGARRSAVLATSFVLALAWGCSGDDGVPGPAGAPGDPVPEPTDVQQGEDPPGVVLEIVKLSGATGPGGRFRTGDTVAVTFTVEKDDGGPWGLGEFELGRVMISGPSFNYQRVIPEQADLLAASKKNLDGSYSYSFSAPLPAVYAAPYNDTASFGPGDGELTGQPLLSGTYTLGMYVSWRFTVDGSGSFRDVGNATRDFRVGGGSTLAPREAVKTENCNQCHESLRAHGGLRRDVKLCLLCHTAGSEDRNVASAAGGTPGVTVDFKVMIHKIHNGAHLPSVLGVATNPDGSRNYLAPAEPYELVGFGNNVHDYSEVGFPVWPNLNIGMPRDVGYGDPGNDTGKENAILTGVTDCNVCHGDPDGAGPLTAPSQGALAAAQPSRASCGACHDDVDWTLPYAANEQVMDPQPNDGDCKLCHEPSGTPLSVVDAHLHPLKRPLVNPGLHFGLTSVGEGLPNGVNPNGALDPGERVEVTFSLTDDLGMDVVPTDVSGMSAVISGPTHASQLLLNTSIPSDVLGATAPSYTMNLPERVQLEFLAQGNGAVPNESWSTLRTPHWTSTATPTDVFSLVLDAPQTTLSSDHARPSNFLDVADASVFVRDDVVVVDPSGAAEFLTIQYVDLALDRVWFASPYQSFSATASVDYSISTLQDHFIGDVLRKVTLTGLMEGVDYTLTPATGTIQEIGELGAVALLVSYTTDFLMPDVYPLALNGSPVLDDSTGKWTGKTLEDGTYTVGLWGRLDLSVTVGTAPNTETTNYRGTSPSATADFAVGGADPMALEPYELISGAQNCYDCHQDMYFHGGGRRGVETCLICHGTIGAEDRPIYRAANAPDTSGLQVTFREMLHKIHMGAELANASSYEVIGFGSTYPNNFSVHTYEEVEFPAMPGGVMNCASCHGDGNEAWHEPSDREHSTQQVEPLKKWTAVCAACHDSVEASVHISGQTTPAGVESCGVCHDPSSSQGVERAHESY